MLRKIDVSTSTCQVKLLKALATTNPRGGGGYCHIWAAVKGMVFKQFTLG